MKNPWMSAWLSAAAQAAGAARAACAARQQRAWIGQMQKAFFAGLPGEATGEKKRAPRRRRRSS